MVRLPKFIELSDEIRSQIYDTATAKLGMAPLLIEKDVWVCWALNALFTIDDGVEMAFKGGTSLSKAYNAISRFSEDIDVTVAYESLDQKINPFAVGITKSERKRLASTMITSVHKYVKERVEPHFRQLLSNQLPNGGWNLEVLDDGEILNLTYPTITAAAESDSGYIQKVVRIEFGGRNATTPSEKQAITPYLEGLVDGVELPNANVVVLSPQRTFWEKATLTHVECNRNEPRKDSSRLSRHWYDLFMLANNEIGRKALADRALLEDVVRFKKVFYDSSYANYDECLSKELKIIPSEEMLTTLRLDYKNMIRESMFQVEPPAFDEIIERLRVLEADINA